MRFFFSLSLSEKILKILSIYIVSRFWLVCTKNGRITDETGRPTIFNKNVSSGQKKLSAETLSDLKRLYLVSRFHNKGRQQHGNQRAQAGNSFGFLFYDTGDQAQHSAEVVSILVLHCVLFN